MRTVGTGIGLSLVISTHWDMAVTSLFLSIWPSIAAIWQFNLPVAAQSSWLAGKAITENASSQSHQQSMTEGWSVKAETQAEKNRIVWEKVNWNIGKRREAGKYEKIRLEVLEPEGVTRCQTPPHPPHTQDTEHSLQIQQNTACCIKIHRHTQMYKLSLNQRIRWISWLCEKNWRLNN